MLPDYDGGSIANLMSSIAEACGAPPPPQAPLHARFGVDAARLARARNIVLIVVDGLGMELLTAHGSGALRGAAGPALTSVFPSTTASAIPVFMTGRTPAQHALTGWHMWLDELQAVAAILPLAPRAGPPFATPRERLPALLFDHAPIYPDMHRPAFLLAPQEIAGSPFNAYHARGARVLPYAGLDAAMQTLGTLLRRPEAKFVYAYWPTLDSVSHRHGCRSEQALAALTRFCDAFDAMLEDAAGSDTVVLVSADHGFIDSPPERVIELESLPQLAALLDRPLCGEQRVAWCYARPGAAAELEACARESLGARAEVVPRARLLDERWFGPGPVHPKLAARIGDCALVMQDDWSIKDWLDGEARHTTLGVHGGVSVAEMRVPLVYVEV